MFDQWVHNNWLPCRGLTNLQFTSTFLCSFQIIKMTSSLLQSEFKGISTEFKNISQNWGDGCGGPWDYTVNSWLNPRAWHSKALFLLSFCKMICYDHINLANYTWFENNNIKILLRKRKKGWKESFICSWNEIRIFQWADVSLFHYFPFLLPLCLLRNKFPIQTF